MSDARLESQPGGTVIAREMPRCVLIDRRLVAEAPREERERYGLSVSGKHNDRVTITCTNGRWVYQLLGWEQGGTVGRFAMIEGTPIP